MRDLGTTHSTGGSAAAMLPSVAEVEAWVGRLGRPSWLSGADERIDLIRALERLKCAAEGA